ncbi:MAG: CPBP family intramembrane glutamic endopeptidase [Candidatus Micrarchaeia archaeon]
MFPILGWMFAHGLLSTVYFEADSTIALSLLFPSLAFSYLFYKGASLSEAVKSLKLDRRALTTRALGAGLLLFFAILLLEFALSAFQTITHIPLPTNVQQLLQGMPFYLIAFSVLVAPIDEEILFRGFLVPRIGIIWSALIFSLFHISYLSISEFAAAFIFGLLAGYVFKKTDSLYATILGHALVNLLTILVLFL